MDTEHGSFHSRSADADAPPAVLAPGAHPAQDSLPPGVQWEQLESLYADIAGLADSGSNPETFPRELARLLATQLRIPGVAVWTGGESNRLELQTLCEREERLIDTRDLSQRRHQEFLMRAMQLSDSSRNNPAAIHQLANLTTTGTASGAGSASGVTLAALALRLGTIHWFAGILELFVPAEQLTAYAHVLEGLSDPARGFYLAQRLETLESAASVRDDFRSWLTEMARAEPRDALPTVLVNETRRFLRCDRVSLFLRGGGGSRVRTSEVSGVKAVEPRAAALDELVHIAELMIEHDVRSPVSQGNADTAVPALREILVTMDSGDHVRREIVALPLTAPGATADIALNAAPTESGDSDPAVGVLICEWFTSDVPTDLSSRLTLLHPATVATAQRLETGRGPWWQRVLAGGGRKAIVFSVSALLLTAALLVPAEFTVEAHGVIQPAELQDVFAPLDGTVQELQVDTDDPVTESDQLLRLHSPELEQEIERIDGLILARQRSLDSVRAERLIGIGGFGTSIGSSGGPADRRGLSADEVQLQAELDGLQAQRDVLRDQKRLLDVRSPIDGTVLTWNLRRVLQNRPVKSGQLLLTVGNPDGVWTVELQIPDRYAGYVLEARQSAAEPLEVDFMVGTAVGTRHTVPLRHVAQTSEPGVDGQSFVRAEADIVRSEVPGVRPGATVTGRIHCGRRALGFVWFHDLWAFLQTNVLF